jgi:thymidylate synthase
MAWEWSHTNEAYETARMNLNKLKRGELNTIFSEWKAYFYRERTTQDEASYHCHWRKHTRNLPTDILADQIWDWMEELRTCDNGGFFLWACPYGCHTVSCG